MRIPSDQHRSIQVRSLSNWGSTARPGPIRNANTSTSTVSSQPAASTIVAKKRRDHLGDMVSRITIAGIEDAYKAKTKFERYAFLAAIVVDVFAMIYSSVFIVLRYAKEDPIKINRAEILDVHAPFPNVSVCLPQMKDPRIRRRLVFPAKALRAMEKAEISVDEMVEFMEVGTSSFYGGKEKESPLKSVIGAKILDASLDADYRFIREVLKTPCEEAFFECTFGGNPFDCCSVAEYMMIDHGSCWYFDMSTIERQLNSTPHHQQIIPGGLTMDVVMDKRLVNADDNVLPDGIIVHIDQIPSMFSAPEVIPFGAEARIILAEPVLLHQLAPRCQSNEQLPNLTRLNYYDPHGVLCTMDKFLDFLAAGAGCDPIPFLTFVPTNATRCAAGMLLATLRLIGGDVDVGRVSGAAAVVDVDKIGYDFLIDVYRSCRPLCKRWSYSVYSSSYGYIHYRRDRQYAFENISMTRLRVYSSQDIGYQQRIEAHSNLVYLAFCKIGGVWAVYLGFSIVSVLQIIAYAFILWRKRKKVRVAVGPE